MQQKFIDESDDTDEKIVLDRSTFKALASNSRVDILKELDLRRKTLSELSESLSLSVATTKEHLTHLVNAKLISLKDDGRKWKYYELTEKGRCILYPERKKLWVLLISLLAVVSFSVMLSSGSFLFAGMESVNDAATFSRMAALPEGDASSQDAAVAMIATDEVTDGVDSDQLVEATDLQNAKIAGAELLEVADTGDANANTEQEAATTETELQMPPHPESEEAPMMLYGEPAESSVDERSRILEYGLLAVSFIILLMMTTTFFSIKKKREQLHKKQYHKK